MYYLSKHICKSRVNYLLPTLLYFIENKYILFFSSGWLNYNCRIVELICDLYEDVDNLIQSKYRRNFAGNSIMYVKKKHYPAFASP